MLDTLLAAESRGEIDAAGIQEEVDTFTFEGHDTTASGLLFCIFLIATHRDVQSKVLAEIRRVIGDKQFEDITMQDLSEMEYFNRVLKECLRIYPPVPFIARALGEDWTSEYGVVPQGSLIQIHIFDLHRDPEEFPDPEKFDPDRFLPENSEKRHPFAYVPFSAGPRNCIGEIENNGKKDQSNLWFVLQGKSLPCSKSKQS
jgi:cytochrome P450 family 4